MERREEEEEGKKTHTAADAAFSTKRNCQHRRFVEAIAVAELPLSGKEAHPVPRFPASLLPCFLPPLSFVGAGRVAEAR